MAESRALVIDASAMVDLLLGTDRASAIRASVRSHALVAPAHFDAEVVSAIGRLHRGGALEDRSASSRVDRLASAPVSRAPLAPLLRGAWARRGDTRLADALYIELAETLDTVVVTLDTRLARAHPERTLVPGER